MSPSKPGHSCDWSLSADSLYVQFQVYCLCAPRTHQQGWEPNGSSQMSLQGTWLVRKQWLREGVNDAGVRELKPPSRETPSPALMSASRRVTQMQRSGRPCPSLGSTCIARIRDNFLPVPEVSSLQKLPPSPPVSPGSGRSQCADLPKCVKQKSACIF